MPASQAMCPLGPTWPGATTVAYKRIYDVQALRHLWDLSLPPTIKICTKYQVKGAPTKVL